MEHPFAPVVRILGKGKKGTRSLEQDEARDAMRMILKDQVRPEQLGAFLMLLRVKEESPAEIAGFVEAAREQMAAPAIAVDLDWSSYAGKRRQLPWFMLAALLLAENGFRIFMHGARGHTPNRLYTQDMLALFGLETCQDWQQVAKSLDQRRFAFMSIEQLCPKMADIIQLRPILGLRSPVHTLCRLLNPLGAACSIDGVFHPPYAPMHQHAAELLGVQNAATIKGDGGEAELKPDDECHIKWILNGELSEQDWPRIYPQRLVKSDTLDPQDMLALWRGEIEHAYGEGAVLNTLAVCLKLLGRAQTPEEAVATARQMWQARNTAAY